MGKLTNEIIDIVENFRKESEVKPQGIARLTQLGVPMTEICCPYYNKNKDFKSNDEIIAAWEKYEEDYPLLADHYRSPTIYVRGKSLDDKIEITHKLDEEDEKPKWKGSPF